MKQSISIFLFWITLSFFSFSQGVYSEIEVGYSFPLGQFKSAAGFTGGRVFTGFHAGAAVGYSFNPTWSLGIRTIYTNNGASGPNTVFLDEFPLWENRSLLLTAKISRPVFENFFAELEGQAGNMWASFPFTFSFGQNSFDRNPEKSAGFVSGVRIGFKYYLSEKVAAKMSINYLEANIKRGNDQQFITQNVSLSLFSTGILIEL